MPGNGMVEPPVEGTVAGGRVEPPVVGIVAGGTVDPPVVGIVVPPTGGTDCGVPLGTVGTGAGVAGGT